MENKHWIQGDTECQNPLFRKEFFLEELPETGKISVCGLGYFLLYGKLLRDTRYSKAEMQENSFCIKGDWKNEIFF